MQIHFADRLPAGDYALVLPVAGKDRKALAAPGMIAAGSRRLWTTSASRG